MGDGPRVPEITISPELCVFLIAEGALVLGPGGVCKTLSCMLWTNLRFMEPPGAQHNWGTLPVKNCWPAGPPGRVPSSLRIPQCLQKLLKVAPVAPANGSGQTPKMLPSHLLQKWGGGRRRVSEAPAVTPAGAAAPACRGLASPGGMPPPPSPAILLLPGPPRVSPQPSDGPGLSHRRTQTPTCRASQGEPQGRVQLEHEAGRFGLAGKRQAGKPDSGSN